ncbi:hypothetical protein GOM49_10650 [Clostridium bovifaecis]|uniref:Membrane-spanning protein n=1 Tax=Clostridium bovifaecis TaxID=2184719 RepID=A0A6I6F4Q7_9CLOT|nr:hypothetical protein GOM49_10650 [Clostridium bovifaecis]
MNNRNSKRAIGIAVLFEIILITASIGNIMLRQWRSLALLLLAIVCLIIPFVITYIANKKRIWLPHNFQLIMVIFIFLAQYLGEIKKFYAMFWWWDLFLHAIFGSYTVIIALYSLKGIIKKDQEATEQLFTIFTIIFAFSFSVAVGTLWEVFEFVGDYLFNSNMVKGGLKDTLTDLIVKILAAFITSVKYYYGNLRR